jgi:protein-S-isoprenylcysteine O-methyltransferase Ste14
VTRLSGSVTKNHPRDTAGVLAAPPILFAAALIIALAGHAVRPIRITPGSAGMVRLAGGVLIAVGVALSVAVMRAFASAGTEISPYRPTTHFVASGPYRYSRNPDYIGQTLTYAGIALVANSWWPLLLLPLVLIAIDRAVVAREERYLERKFQQYTEYKERVRRWI